MFKVECISASQKDIKSGSVAVGKVYKVVKELKNYYIIKDDRGICPSVCKTKFKKVEVASQNRGACTP